jgi:hypothetical protein
MLPLIEQHQHELEALCQRFFVARLELFGSAVGGAFDSARSDLDFLVEFRPLAPRERADAYFGLLHSLEDLLGRKIDLVSDQAANNRFFRHAVDSQRTLLYAA